MAHGIPARLTAAEGRKFALTVGIAFLLLAALLGWRGGVAAAGIAGSLGGALLLAGLVAPAQLGPVYRAWMGLAVLLSKVTTPLFMGAVYFLVLTPIGLLRRAAGKSPIHAGPSPAGSYWRAADRPRSNLQRQF